MTGVRIGSLFSGAGMLDEGVRAVVGGTVAWHAEVDPAACKVLACRYPDVPNLGDVTDLDWTAVPPVDVLTGGSPCQDVSHAGRRAGMRAGTRSGLWAAMCDAIDILRPALVVWENVRGVLSAEADSALEPCPGCVGDPDDGAVLRALGRVLGDLAGLGYDTRWCGLRAADVGAPHSRFRVFVVAWPATDTGREHGQWWRADAVSRGLSGPDPSDQFDVPAPTVADAAHVGHQRHRPTRDRRTGPENSSRTTPDTDGERLQGRDRGKEAAGTAPLATRCGSRGFAAADASGDGWDARRTESAQLIRRPDAAISGAVVADAGRDRYDGDEEQDSRAFTGREEALGRDDVDGRALRRVTEPTASDAGGERLPQQPGNAPTQETRPGTDHVPTNHRGERAPTDWGPYRPAIERWQRTLGRPAPAPTETAPRGGQRLSPLFVEWLMGWPEGWVTDIPGVTRNDQLKICGNGVVPQQAAAAIRAMLTAQECAA